MEPNTYEQLLMADIPRNIKDGLVKLDSAAAPLLPSLDRSVRRRYNSLLDHLFREVIDDTLEPQWWETTLYFWNKVASNARNLGTELRTAIDHLHPLLASHLGQGGEVRLQEITMETVMGICLLSDTLTEPKKYFVAPNVYSLAQAHFHKYAWFRAIYAGKAPVGFMMIVDGEPNEEKGNRPEYFLWRLMIAEPFHGRNYGRQAILRLVEYVRTRPKATELLVSCGQGEGSPQGFYERLGFTLTGEKLGDEVVLSLSLE